MNAKGRKTYVAEIAELKQEIMGCELIIKRKDEVLRAVSRDFLSLLDSTFISALKSLIRFRKEFKTKNHEYKEDI